MSVQQFAPTWRNTKKIAGTYFNCIMFMVASSVVTTIMILNYHHRLSDTHKMPNWVRSVWKCHLFSSKCFLSRWEYSFFSGSPGCWGCLDQERRSRGRPSWSRTRWRRWTWRRTPPSLSWRTSSTWTMTSAPPRSTTTSSHRLPTSPKAHNRTLPAVCSGAFCASLVLEPYLSQGLPHPSPLRGELLKLWCSPGALLHPQGDPGDHNCMFHHT